MLSCSNVVSILLPPGINPRCGFARICCPDCQAEHLLVFSCRTRGFCPSCHSKRLEEWGEWMREVTEGGVEEAGLFPKVPRIDDPRPAEIFAREVLRFLVHQELLTPEWAERLLPWRHTGFNVQSRVRARTKREAERVGKYMIRPLLSLERLSFSEKEAKICYRYGKDAREMEPTDYYELSINDCVPVKSTVELKNIFKIS